MSEISEFTKKAIELARNQIHERADYSSLIERQHPREIKLRLTRNDIDLFIKAFQVLRSKSKEQLTRARNFPSDTIRSSVTIEKHEAIIDHIDTVLSHFCEETLE